MAQIPIEFDVVVIEQITRRQKVRVKVDIEEDDVAEFTGNPDELIAMYRDQIVEESDKVLDPKAWKHEINNTEEEITIRPVDK